MNRLPSFFGTCHGLRAARVPPQVSLRRRRRGSDKAPDVGRHVLSAKVDAPDVLPRSRPADGPVVLLLHGSRHRRTCLRTSMPLLADKYRVIAPDYPVSATSDAPGLRQFVYSFSATTPTWWMRSSARSAPGAMPCTSRTTAIGRISAGPRHPARWGSGALIVQNGNAL